MRKQVLDWSKPLALLLILIVIGVACSADQDTPTSVPPSTATATPTVTLIPSPTSTLVATPTHTPAPTPSPQPVVAEEELRHDDFTDPNSNWPTLDLESGRYGYHPPDFYHVEVSAPDDSLTVFQGPDFDDITVETEVLVDHTGTEEGDFRYGLAIRRVADQYYAFTVSPRTKSWQVLKSSPIGLESLAEGAFDALRGMTALDKLRVDASGPNFIFSINDQVVTQVNDPDYVSGEVGFFVNNLDESLAHIHYDVLTIREVEIDAVAVVPMPTPLPPTLPSSVGMINVPGGTYQIGLDAPGNAYVAQQVVALTEFWIDLYEVTNGEYAAFLAETGQPVPSSWADGSLPAGQEDHPVEGVTWDQAVAYCEWAKKRLPTEAEWEVVARGAVGWLYPWGNDERAVELPRSGTYPVGSVSENRSPFGVYDMAGNTWEWVGDTYAPVTDGHRVLRGGAHGFLKDMAYRLQGDPSLPTMFATAGIRCAADQVIEEQVVQAEVGTRDEFADPDSGWPTLDLESGRYGYHPPDYYHVEVSAPDDSLTVFQGPSFDDVTVETEVLVDHTDTEDGDFRYGLAIRQTEEGYYAFTVSPRTGSWQVLKRSAAGLETLAQGTADTLLGMSALDALQVDASGPNFIFSINSQAVTQVSDAEYASGEIGFYVETFDETLAHIHYDALTIRDVQVSVRADEARVQDDFADPGSGWPTLDLESGRYGYHPPDYYHVEVSAPDDSLTVFQGPSFDDVTVSTEVLVDHTDTEGGDFRYGLAVRQTEEGYYAFTVSPRTGSWQVLKRSATGLETLAEGTIDTLLGMSALDALQVDASGPNFIFSINGQAVTQVSDAEYASGEIGFYVETFDETLAHIHYDALTIRDVQVSVRAEEARVEDDFADPGSGWPTLDLESGRYGYHPPDYYHVEVSAADDSLTVFQSPSFDDVTVSTEVLVDHTDTEDGNFRYGLAIRQTEDGYYAFTVSPRTGSWQVLKRSTTGLETMAEGTVDALRGMISVDKLQVDASGPNFIFSINGQAVTQVSDADYGSGVVGFYVETFDETLAHIHFDSLTIREVEASESVPLGPWQAAYYANQTLSGDPLFIRQDAAIDFDWGMDAPHPALPSDRFSVHWQATLNFEAGRYLFTSTTDDGVRLLVDGQVIIESWRPMRGYRSGLVDLAGGQHALVVEYFEEEGAAMARLNWVPIDLRDSP